MCFELLFMVNYIQSHLPVACRSSPFGKKCYVTYFQYNAHLLFAPLQTSCSGWSFRDIFHKRVVDAVFFADVHKTIMMLAGNSFRVRYCRAVHCRLVLFAFLKNMHIIHNVCCYERSWQTLLLELQIRDKVVYVLNYYGVVSVFPIIHCTLMMWLIR